MMKANVGADKRTHADFRNGGESKAFTDEISYQLNIIGNQKSNIVGRFRAVQHLIDQLGDVNKRRERLLRTHVQQVVNGAIELLLKLNSSSSPNAISTCSCERRLAEDRSISGALLILLMAYCSELWTGRMTVQAPTCPPSQHNHSTLISDVRMDFNCLFVVHALWHTLDLEPGEVRHNVVLRKSKASRNTENNNTIDELNCAEDCRQKVSAVRGFLRVIGTLLSKRHIKFKRGNHEYDSGSFMNGSMRVGAQDDAQMRAQALGQLSGSVESARTANEPTRTGADIVGPTTALRRKRKFRGTAAAPPAGSSEGSCDRQINGHFKGMELWRSQSVGAVQTSASPDSTLHCTLSLQNQFLPSGSRDPRSISIDLIKPLHTNPSFNTSLTNPAVVLEGTLDDVSGWEETLFEQHLLPFLSQYFSGDALLPFFTAKDTTLEAREKLGQELRSAEPSLRKKAKMEREGKGKGQSNGAIGGKDSRAGPSDLAASVSTLACMFLSLLCEDAVQRVTSSSDADTDSVTKKTKQQQDDRIEGESERERCADGVGANDVRRVGAADGKKTGKYEVDMEMIDDEGGAEASAEESFRAAEDFLTQLQKGLRDARDSREAGEAGEADAKTGVPMKRGAASEGPSVSIVNLLQSWLFDVTSTHLLPAIDTPHRRDIYDCNNVNNNNNNNNNNHHHHHHHHHNNHELSKRIPNPVAPGITFVFRTWLCLRILECACFRNTENQATFLSVNKEPYPFRIATPSPLHSLMAIVTFSGVSAVQGACRMLSADDGLCSINSDLSSASAEHSSVQSTLLCHLFSEFPFSSSSTSSPSSSVSYIALNGALSGELFVTALRTLISAAHHHPVAYSAVLQLPLCSPEDNDDRVNDPWEVDQKRGRDRGIAAETGKKRRRSGENTVQWLVAALACFASLRVQTEQRRAAMCSEGEGVSQCSRSKEGINNTGIPQHISPGGPLSPTETRFERFVFDALLLLMSLLGDILECREPVSMGAHARYYAPLLRGDLLRGVIDYPSCLAAFPSFQVCATSVFGDSSAEKSLFVLVIEMLASETKLFVTELRSTASVAVALHSLNEVRDKVKNNAETGAGSALNGIAADKGSKTRNEGKEIGTSGKSGAVPVAELVVAAHCTLFLVALCSAADDFSPELDSHIEASERARGTEQCPLSTDVIDPGWDEQGHGRDAEVLSNRARRLGRDLSTFREVGRMIAQKMGLPSRTNNLNIVGGWCDTIPDTDPEMETLAADGQCVSREGGRERTKSGERTGLQGLAIHEREERGTAECREGRSGAEGWWLPLRLIKAFLSLQGQTGVLVAENVESSIAALRTIEAAQKILSASPAPNVSPSIDTGVVENMQTMRSCTAVERGATYSSSSSIGQGRQQREDEAQWREKTFLSIDANEGGEGEKVETGAATEADLEWLALIQPSEGRTLRGPQPVHHAALATTNNAESDTKAHAGEDTHTFTTTFSSRLITELSTQHQKSTKLEELREETSLLDICDKTEDSEGMLGPGGWCEGDVSLQRTTVYEAHSILDLSAFSSLAPTSTQPAGQPDGPPVTDLRVDSGAGSVGDIRSSQSLSHSSGTMTNSSASQNSPLTISASLSDNVVGAAASDAELERYNSKLIDAHQPPTALLRRAFQGGTWSSAGDKRQRVDSLSADEDGETKAKQKEKARRICEQRSPAAPSSPSPVSSSAVSPASLKPQLELISASRPILAPTPELAFASQSTVSTSPVVASSSGVADVPTSIRVSTKSKGKGRPIISSRSPSLLSRSSSVASQPLSDPLTQPPSLPKLVPYSSQPPTLASTAASNDSRSNSTGSHGSNGNNIRSNSSKSRSRISARKREPPSSPSEFSLSTFIADRPVGADAQGGKTKKSGEQQPQQEKQRKQGSVGSAPHVIRRPRLTAQISGMTGENSSVSRRDPRKNESASQESSDRQEVKKVRSKARKTGASGQSQQQNGLESAKLEINPDLAKPGIHRKRKFAGVPLSAPPSILLSQGSSLPPSRHLAAVATAAARNNKNAVQALSSTSSSSSAASSVLSKSLPSSSSPPSSSRLQQQQPCLANKQVAKDVVKAVKIAKAVQSRKKQSVDPRVALQQLLLSSLKTAPSSQQLRESEEFPETHNLDEYDSDGETIKSSIKRSHFPTRINAISSQEEVEKEGLAGQSNLTAAALAAQDRSVEYRRGSFQVSDSRRKSRASHRDSLLLQEHPKLSIGSVKSDHLFLGSQGSGNRSTGGAKMRSSFTRPDSSLSASGKAGGGGMGVGIMWEKDQGTNIGMTGEQVGKTTGGRGETGGGWRYKRKLSASFNASDNTA